MTFSVSRDRSSLEWAGASLSSLFCQRLNLLSPRFWRMLFDIVRFNVFAPDLLAKDDAALESIGSYLERKGYSDAFRDDYLIPMTTAIWCTGPEKCALDFPALTLVRFLWNHRLLSATSARPRWLTLKNCAKSYIDAIMSDVSPDHVFLSTPVRSLMNEPSGKVRLLLENGTTALYDCVVLATHGDQAYSIVEHTATREEREVLSAFSTVRNTAVLHSDASLLPRNPAARSSWNYSSTSDPAGGAAVCLTYDMNSLQHIPTSTFGDVLLTLNPVPPPRPGTVQAELEYSHPVYTREAVAAQKRLPELQGGRGVWFAGARTGFGSHEDGFVSGLRAAEGLGAVVRWVREKRRVRRVGVRLWVVRIVIWVLQRVVVRNLERVFGRGGSRDEEKKRV